MKSFLRAIALAALCWTLGGSLAIATDASPAPEITIDTTKTPDMAEWAAEAKSRCEKSYGMIVETLGAEGYKPPKKIEIIFHDDDGIAATAGHRIYCAAKWFRAHPDDYGAVVHEVSHVVQAYGNNRVPGWVTEGLADYARWFQYEPANKRPKVDFRRAKYTDGYQTTAALFDWIVRTKDKNFVKRMNEAARQGKYKDELFEDFAGAPVADLWKEFGASQKR